MNPPIRSITWGKTMHMVNYLYEFEPITDQGARIYASSSLTTQKQELAVTVNDAALSKLRSRAYLPPIVADLLDIAAAVHVGDRVSERPSNGYCNIQIVLPVRCPAELSGKEVKERLTDILYWYTGYKWIFEFNERNAAPRKLEAPLLLPEPDELLPKEVSLWSGGLDALAGLFQRLDPNSRQKHVLVGSGSNKIVYHRQRELATKLFRRFPGQIELIQVAIAAHGDLPKNPTLRSRGFVFMLVGAVASYSEGQNALYIYENGIGAINLPFRRSEIGLDHARSVHPLSLLDMSELLTQILGEPFRFHNPFLFWTKAQMCSVLPELNALDIAYETVSCDRTHRRKDAKQCGRCSSCILRRHAFAALGLEDPTSYVYSDFPTQGQVERLRAADHLPAILHQVQDFREHLSAPDPWRSLSREYDSLQFEIVDQTAKFEGISPDEMTNSLLNLIGQYVYEWDVINQRINV